jgi:hypothetical protein
MGVGRAGRLLAVAGLAAFLAPRFSPSGVLIELTDARGRRLPRLEASGIAAFADRFLVVDDTLNSIFVFDERGRLRQSLLPARFPRERAKLEELVVDSASGFGLAVGSHEGNTPELLAAMSQLVSFRVHSRREEIVIDPESVESLPLYRSFERVGLWKPRTMKIEGLALDGATGFLYIGLREPRHPSQIYRSSLARLQDAARGAEPAPLEEAFLFDAGAVGETRFHLSALTWLAERGGLLIATSTEDDRSHRFLGNRLWYGSAAGEVRLLRDTFDSGLKAEGMTVKGGDLYICYDNDQDDTGIPSQLRRLPLKEIFPDS